MTDAQWAVVEPLLPPPGNTAGRGGRPEKHPRRVILDAIFSVVRGGIAWRQLPADFPPAMTVYDLFRRWARTGVWARVHDGLRDLVRVHAGRDPLPTAAIIDSQTVRGAGLLVALRARFRTIRHVWADGGYAGRLLSWAYQVLSVTVDIVKRTDTVSGFLVLPRRWVLERIFGWITKHRRCVRDYETLPQHHEAMVTIAMIMTMSRRLARTGDW